MTDVIYEDPGCTLPDKARWFAHDSLGESLWFADKPVLIDSGWGFSHWRYTHNTYAVPGPWQDSLRRIIRLDDPGYYVPDDPNNPYTDDGGFLPHLFGGPPPEHIEGKQVQVVVLDELGRRVLTVCADDLDWWSWSCVVAYRIVGDGPSQGSNPDGSEDREAGEPDPSPMLLADNRAMRQAGNTLAEAAIRVAKEYDGTHRLMIAVSEWCRVIGDEGGRASMLNQENDHE